MNLLIEDKLQKHKTSKEEIRNLVKVVERDLADAAILQLSIDRRYATAYNAALQLATIVLHISGYRTRSNSGHHWVTFALLPKFMGEKETERADFFNACRMKRNMTDYDRAGEISPYELKELLKEVVVFREEVQKWLKKQSLPWTTDLVTRV